MARSQVPRAAIDWVVGNESCGTSIAEVRGKIEARARKQGRTPAQVRAWGAYAAKVHARNVKLYCDVQSGRIGRGRR